MQIWWVYIRRLRWVQCLPVGRAKECEQIQVDKMSWIECHSWKSTQEGLEGNTASSGKSWFLLWVGWACQMIHKFMKSISYQWTVCSPYYWTNGRSVSARTCSAWIGIKISDHSLVWSGVRGCSYNNRRCIKVQLSVGQNNSGMRWCRGRISKTISKS